jgi:hypothetical protein
MRLVDDVLQKVFHGKIHFALCVNDKHLQIVVAQYRRIAVDVLYGHLGSCQMGHGKTSSKFT